MNVIKRQKGFTLIEAIIVIAIIGIMAAIVIPHYSSNKNAKAINFAETQIINDIRYVQNTTLGGTKLPDGDIPKGGFGIYIKKGDNYFTIFGDKNLNKKYDGSDGTMEVVNLEGGVYVSQLEQCTDKSCGSVSSISRMDYVYIPPYGIGSINNTPASEETVVKITLSNGSIQSSFIVSSSGYVSHTN